MQYPIVYQIRSRPKTLSRLFVILGLMLSFATTAQADGGGYVCSPTEQDPPWVAPPHSVPNIRSAIIPLNIYIGRDANGEGGASPAQVDSTVSRLIADYAAHNINFEITYIDLWGTLGVGGEWSLMGNSPYNNAVSAYLAPAPENNTITVGQSQWIPGRRCSILVKGSWDNSRF